MNSFIELGDFFLVVIELLHHVAVLFFPLTSTNASTFTVLNEAVLLWWKELSHTYQLCFRYLLNINREIADSDNIVLSEILICCIILVNIRSIVGVAWFIILAMINNTVR